MCYEREIGFEAPRPQQQQHQPASGIEQALLNAKQPLDVNAGETVQAGPFRGIYLNKQEVDQWRGPVPIEQYRLNDDPNPEVIRKRLDKVRYTQECGVKYLNPPPAPKPGDIIIRERQTNLPPAPPLIVYGLFFFLFFDNEIKICNFCLD
jgi:hypothetical protein